MVDQIEYNVFKRDEKTIRYCNAHNITVEAYSPLGGSHSSRSVFHDPTVQAIAASHNKSAAQIALRWIVQRGAILTVLSGSPEHQAVDADLWRFTLSDEDMKQLDGLRDAD